MSVAASLLNRARADGLAQRAARCFSVSVLTTSISLATLAVLTARVGMAAWVANVAATALGTIVSYRLNRQWVLHRSDASDPWREVVPFLVMFIDPKVFTFNMVVPVKVLPLVNSTKIKVPRPCWVIGMVAV